MKPYAFSRSLLDIDAAELWAHGFRGLIVDVDNTLLGFEAAEVSDATSAWMASARGLGFRVILVSNNFPPRVEKIAKSLGCEGIPNALKPLPFGMLKARRALGCPAREIVIIGDQLLTDILGARCIGIRGILVNPITAKDFPLTKVLRFLERRILGSRKPTS